jgi:predicted MFS family arabinose efflux permease
VSPRWATAGVFFVNGMGVGTLLSHIPYVQERLDVSKGVIGLCLLSMTAGALIAMPIAGQVLERRPSARVVRAGALVYPVTLAFPLLADTALGFAALLFLVGAANGWIDVSMNAHGSAVERSLERPIMSSLHAAWSVGGVAGAGGAALAAALDVDPRAYVAVAAAGLWIVALVVTRHLGRVSAAGGGTGFVLPSRDVLALGLFCILVMVCEGAINDWGPLYLRGDLDSGPAIAAAGFATFSAGMALGRIFGDAIVRRLGPNLVLRGGAALAAVALGLTLVVGHPAVALIGFTLFGLGVANGVPLMFSAAGRTRNPGPAIAAVSTMGYVAFLGGPPALGFLADAVTLPWALATICLAAATVAIAGRA